MISIPPRSYVIIENPVIRNKEGDVEYEDGQVKLAFADSEIRLSQEPFPLYPGEILKQVFYLSLVLIHIYCLNYA